MTDSLTKLDDICTIFDGPHATPKKIDQGPYFLSISSLDTGRLDLSKSAHVSPNDFSKWTKRVTPQEGDILFSYETRLGEAALMPPNITACLGRRMGLLRPKKDKVLPEYLLYAYLSPQFQQIIVSNTIRGATVNRISLSEMPNFSIRIPNLTEQKKVSAFLKCLDDKIELNNKINAQLESIAKLIYDYWFVQFDFPDVNGKPYKSSGGKMIYNEVLKKDIPENWTVTHLSEWIESDKTGDWGKESEEGNYTLQVDCIRGADINGLNGNETVKAPNRFILEKNRHKVLSPYDLVVEISGGSPTQSTGRMAYLTNETIARFKYPLICSNFCKAISLKNNDYFYYFVYLWNEIYENGVLFGWEGKTSGIKNLLFDSFVSNYNACLPPEDLAKKFCLLMQPIQKKRQTALKEIAELNSLRNWLLPILMNGQVKVK